MKEVLERINHPLVLDLYSAHPMTDEVFQMFSRVTFGGGAEGAGEFEPGSHLWISTNIRATKLRGPADYSGGIHSIYQATYDQREAAARAFSHETGHRLIHLLGEQGSMELKEKWKTEAAAGRILTYRGYVDEQEWMAESFAALVHEKELLRMYDPTGYSLIQALYQRVVSK